MKTFSRALLLVVLLVALSPVFAAVWGGHLNSVYNCDIRDEGGQAHGHCTSEQAAKVYSLMLAPWYLIITIPVAGVIGLVGAGVIGYMRRSQKKS